MYQVSLFLFLALSIEITLFTTNWTWISCKTYGYYISSICSVLFQWWQNPWRCNAVLGIVGLAPSQQKVRQKIIGSKTQSNALSFYRSQNVLGWSKFFVPEQKFIYILWQSQTFCARQKDDLHSVKLVFVPAQKFLKRH